MYFFFFFQAEDGIRDFHVTGVQTCALPISIERRLRREPAPLARDRGEQVERGVAVGLGERADLYASTVARGRRGPGRAGARSAGFASTARGRVARARFRVG